MADNSVIIGNICANAKMHIVINNLCLTPLLQFDDYDIIVSFIVCTDDYEIHTLSELLPHSFGPENLS